MQAQKAEREASEHKGMMIKRMDFLDMDWFFRQSSSFEAHPCSIPNKPWSRKVKYTGNWEMEKAISAEFKRTYQLTNHDDIFSTDYVQTQVYIAIKLAYNNTLTRTL